MSAELGLALVGTVELCLRFGIRLVELSRSIRGAHDEVDGLLLRLESIWNRTSVQLRFMSSVSAKLEEDYVKIQQRLLEKLTGTLSVVVAKLDSVVKVNAEGQESGTRAVKYAFLKNSISRTVQELREWQNEYDPTWFLVVLIHDSLVDATLENPQHSKGLGSGPVSIVSHLRGLLKGSTDDNIHVNLDGKDFDLRNTTALKYASTRVLSRGGDASERSFLIDTLSCSSYVDVGKAKRDSESLAKRLKVANPETFGLLRCQGLVKSKAVGANRLSAIHFVFRMPTQSPPTSLRAELLQEAPVSLTRVLHIAQCLAKSVSFIHVCDFVHKNIRPETIITVPDGNTSPSDAYLLGFDGFRSAYYQTTMEGDLAFERNLYRHPSRQGANVQEPYIMQHDIYALGVCLLEIGLWVSFVAYDDEDTPQMSGGLESDAVGQNFFRTPEMRLKLKEHFVALARERLPSRMGDKYTTVVVHCLTCLDLDNSNFSEGAITDEDGVVVGVRFIEKILLGLNEISM
ncbi:hypothetical protein B0T16DRAFT_72038 [Cercophora newfieldiana]|uniref:Protein kinase domain-containing protein n=1 Tax=Cercophora newfieldiana TaxID=92897 RepID=A0AA39YE58_9PEZI|nr:hypothetical protein B0T16DRAFT_72038 [Cercophora newfieldiana]